MPCDVRDLATGMILPLFVTLDHDPMADASRPSAVTAGTPDRRLDSEEQPMTNVNAERLEHRLAYTVDEAAKVTGLSWDILYDQMRTGKLGYPQGRPPQDHHARTSGTFPGAAILVKPTVRSGRQPTRREEMSLYLPGGMSWLPKDGESGPKRTISSRM